MMQLITKHLSENAKSAGIELVIENVVLSDVTILTCKGCRGCFERSENKCPLKDDIPVIYEKMKCADGIICASPVYVEDVNGQMKNWVDRMAFNSHRPFLAGKPAMLFVTSGAGASKHALRTMGSAISSWGGSLTGSKVYRMGRLMKTEEAEKQYADAIKRQSEKFLRRIFKRVPSVYSILAFTIQQKYWRQSKDNKNSIDYLYWKENGWLDKSCNYFNGDKINWVRLTVSKILGKILGVFFVR